MHRILVVEDSPMVMKVLKHLIRSQLNVEAHYADTFASAQSLVDDYDGDFFAALVDLNLPDAPHGEVAHFILEKGIPCIVLTASYSEDKREELITMGLVDYIVKESRYSYDQAIRILERLDKNRSISVLVVDDSSVSRSYMRQLLEQQLFNVIEAKNGDEALELLTNNPQIRLMLTDYNMPMMDGFELVHAVRQDYNKKDLLIIGLSSDENPYLSARFIKNGANDFLQKPFVHEELHCRVIQCIESLERLEHLREQAYRDHLTQLHNRRYLFEEGHNQYLQAQNEQHELAIALIDIDYIRTVNEEFDHASGDIVITTIARLLEETLGRFLICRFGGDEFCIVMPRVSHHQACQIMHGVRGRVECEIIELPQESVAITVSIGVTNQLAGSLDTQILQADHHLCQAKEAGRNFVIGDS